MPLHGVGGLERSVHDLVRHLAARGVEVTLIVPPAGHVQRPTNADPFASPHIHIRHVPYLSFPFANRRGTTVLDRSTSYLLYGWRAGRLARRLANSGGVDLVHGFGASVLGARSDGDDRRPLVMNPQGLEEFGATGVAAPAEARRLRAAPMGRPPRGLTSVAASSRPTSRSSRRSCGISSRQRVRCGRSRTASISSRPERWPVRPTGCSRDNATGSAPGELVFVSVGRLEFNKGFDLLPAALARASAPGSTLAATGWRWVVVGGGPYRAEIERAGRRPSPRIARDLRRSHERTRSPRVVRSGERVRPPDALRRQLARDAGSHGASTASDCDALPAACLTRSIQA